MPFCRLFRQQDVVYRTFWSNPKILSLCKVLHARESTIPTNGDGFCLGWYVPEISPQPALFTSIYPAWNDCNYFI